MTSAHGWTVTDRTVVFRARKWEVERSRRCRDGQGAAHEFFTLRIPDFVHVIPVTPAGELVMVRQFRHGLEAPTLEFPGGLLDPGESPAEAAARELKEETGFIARSLTALPILHQAPALMNNRAYFFVAQGAEATGEPAPESTEDIRVVLVPRSEAAALVARGELTSGIQVAALLLFLRGAVNPSG